MISNVFIEPVFFKTWRMEYIVWYCENKELTLEEKKKKVYSEDQTTCVCVRVCNGQK